MTAYPTFVSDPVSPLPTTIGQTISPTSTTTAYDFCSVCGQNRQVSNGNALIDRFPGADTQLTCAEFESIGANGGIAPEYCAFMSLYADPCGCVDVSN